jgi:hypothetical protein
LNKVTKLLVAPVAAVAIIAGVAACGMGGTNPQSAAQHQETRAQAQDSYNLINNQPVPVYQYSQERQTLINVEDIQANGENTTTFFFNQGVQNPIMSCSSIGMPVASEAQLTNPEQNYNASYPSGGAAYPIAQMDPTGIYTGGSTGTNVLCVNGNGQQYIQYWEGFVDAVSGPATWNASTHQVQLLGAPDKLKTQSNPTGK